MASKIPDRTKVKKDANAPSIKGIYDWYASKKFADLLIVLPNGEEIRAHKIVLCAQSTFFDKACSNFKEAESSTIKLAFGDPELLELMIEWCYDNTVEYVTREDQLKCQCPTLCVRHGALYYAKLYIITDFYGIDTLKTKAAIELREWLADKDEYGNDDDIEASLSAARLIYTDTPDSDIDIRKAVSKKLATNLPRFQDHKALRKLIDETPALAMDLMKALVQK